MAGFFGRTLQMSDWTYQPVYDPERRTLERQVPTTVSQAQADALIARWATPAVRPRSMTVLPLRNTTNLFPEVLSLDLTDKVSITIPTLGSDPTVTARIAHISHTFDGHNWVTTYGLEPT